MYFVGLVALFSILGSFITMKTNNKIYNYESQLILEQYSEKNFAMASSTLDENDRKRVSFLFLCGSEMFDTIEVSDDKKSIIISVEKDLGDIKILAANSKDDNIISKVLKEGKNEISLSNGQYQLYVVGRQFCGNIQIEK